MKELQDLKLIVSKLTIDERKHELRNPVSDNGIKSQDRKLIAFLIMNPEASSDEIQYYLYNKFKKIAFKQLVYRSKERLLDTLLSNNSIEGFDAFDQRARVLLGLRKKLIQYDILNLRGLQRVSAKILDSIISKSKAYEYYDLLVFAMLKKMRMGVISMSMEDYTRLYKELEHFEDCRAVHRKSEFYLKSLISLISSKSRVHEHKNNLEYFIKDLEGDLFRVKSLTVLNNLLFLKKEFSDENEQFSNSYKFSKKVIDLLTTNSFLYSHYNLGIAYLNLSIVEIRMFDFDNAQNSLKKSYNLLSVIDTNAFMVRQCQFLGYYFTDNRELIEKFLDIINSFFYSGIIPNFFADKVRYYNACIKFIQEDYKSSYILLNQVKVLEQEKESWNISIRILSVMNQIELENYELADTLTENLRKHIERVKKTLPVGKRDEKIVQILTALSRHSYHFRRTFRVKAEAFSLLESLEKEYRWKILSPEMIIFHEWFKAKNEDARYDHFKLMPMINKKYATVHKAFVPLEQDVEILK